MAETQEKQRADTGQERQKAGKKSGRKRAIGKSKMGDMKAG